MKCKECGQDLFVSNNKMKSELNSTDVYSVQTLVCTNQKCSNYAGNDLKNPLRVAETIKTKV